MVWNSHSSSTDANGLTHGVLIFGGIDEKKRVNNDLWLIEPDGLHNRQDILNAHGEFRFKSDQQKLYIKVSKIQA